MEYESETEFGYEGGYEGGDYSDKEVGLGFGVGFLVGMIILMIILIIVASFVTKGDMSVNFLRHVALDSDVVKSIRNKAYDDIDAQLAIEAAAGNASASNSERLSAMWKGERLSSSSGFHKKSEYAGLERTCGARQH